MTRHAGTIRKIPITSSLLAFRSPDFQRIVGTETWRSLEPLINRRRLLAQASPAVITAMTIRPSDRLHASANDSVEPGGGFGNLLRGIDEALAVPLGGTFISRQRFRVDLVVLTGESTWSPAWNRSARSRCTGGRVGLARSSTAWVTDPDADDGIQPTSMSARGC